MILDRAEWLESRLGGFLDRRAVPASLRGKPEAQAGEVAALMKIIKANAPKTGYQGWFEAFESELGRTCTTRAWPNEAEVNSAARAAARMSREGAGAENVKSWVLDPVKINADRMNRGDFVGEEWCYGPLAVQLEDSGRVTPEVMRAYRSGAYWNRVTWRRNGESDRRAADEWERREKEAHRQARLRADEAATARGAPNLGDVVKSFGPARESDATRSQADEPKHWTETASADDPRHEALRQARIKAGTVKENAT